MAQKIQAVTPKAAPVHAADYFFIEVETEKFQAFLDELDGLCRKFAVRRGKTSDYGFKFLESEKRTGESQ